MSIFFVFQLISNEVELITVRAIKMLHYTCCCITRISHIAKILLEVFVIQNNFSAYRTIVVILHVLNYRRYLTNIVCNDVTFKTSSTSHSFNKLSMLILKLNSGAINLFFYEVFARMLCEPFFQLTFITEFKKCSSNKEMLSFLKAVNVLIFSTYGVKQFGVRLFCTKTCNKKVVLLIRYLLIAIVISI